MSIDDMSVPSHLTVGTWRSVLHDVVDDVLDQILLSAEPAWEQDHEEPPGDPPDGIPDLGTTLRDGLGAAIERGVAIRGCDGTLRCTRAYAERILDTADPVLEHYRRHGLDCDCAVLHGVVGRTGVAPRCPGRDGGT